MRNYTSCGIHLPKTWKTNFEKLDRLLVLVNSLPVVAPISSVRCDVTTGRPSDLRRLEGRFEKGERQAARSGRVVQLVAQ